MLPVTFVSAMLVATPAEPGVKVPLAPDRAFVGVSEPGVTASAMPEIGTAMLGAGALTALVPEAPASDTALAGLSVPGAEEPDTPEVATVLDGAGEPGVPTTDTPEDAKVLVGTGVPVPVVPSTPEVATALPGAEAPVPVVPTAPDVASAVDGAAVPTDAVAATPLAEAPPGVAGLANCCSRSVCGPTRKRPGPLTQNGLRTAWKLPCVSISKNQSLTPSALLPGVVRLNEVALAGAVANPAGTPDAFV